MHILCTICSDLVSPSENLTVTTCGHIFHHDCLAQWIRRSSTCPQCRNRVTENVMFRLFPTISHESSKEDPATLQQRLDDATLHLRQKSTAVQEMEEDLKEMAITLKKKDERMKFYEEKIVSRDSAISALQDQVKYLKVQNNETNQLKAQNEELKMKIQTLNGLQDVLNATSPEVEQMLEGYTDLRTVATFATALKRALCESESKKNETRDRLHAIQQQMAVEKTAVAELQAKLSHVECKLADAEHKYESLKNKRKASDAGNQSTSEPNPPKQARTSDIFDSFVEDSFGPSSAKMDDSYSSLNSMVRRIENADSPYLSLKQSNLALTALQRGPISIPTGNMKPSEFAILNAARNGNINKSENITSIFHKKPPLKPEPCTKPATIDLDISYDGLGGHSKLDTFPVPLRRTKSSVPKLTAKHKLKRPTNGSQDIGKLLLGRIMDK